MEDSKPTVGMFVVMSALCICAFAWHNILNRHAVEAQDRSAVQLIDAERNASKQLPQEGHH